ncbi:MAG TPA: hypothetical protein DDX99_15375 [Desulfofustis sp.]|jgi:hypothetical protein|nr:hypothetical protein [Desulfofustis sp. PB-SRB1]HBH30192.1 hypothetical protein [Desulfofustis sp.]HBH32749.1 hypothetical protein [Desulfofustis sp.]
MGISLTAKKSITGAVGAVLLLVAAGGAVSAAESGGWHNEITIYGWLTDIGGTTRFSDINNNDISVDVSDIIANLNMVLMGNYVGKTGRWSIIGDLVYVNLSDSSTTDTALGGAAINLDITSWLLTGAVGYDLIQSDQVLVAAVAGVRYIDVQTDATLSLNGARLADASESEGVTDGIIGLRGEFMLGEHWFIPYYADAGTGGTDVSYQLFGGVGYRFGWGDVRLGYRYLDLDFSDDKLLQDLNMGGPVLGVGFRF